MLLRARSQHGMALPLALGVMLVLSIIIFAMIDFSRANTRTSSLNERRQSAKALAEAGVAHGASFLAQQGDSYTTTPTSGTAVIQGVNVDWEATYAASIWTVSATASPKNPTGAGASDVTRTVEAKFKWTPTGGPSLWRGLYIGNPSIRPLLSNSTASIKTNVYARGDLTLTQGKYLGESFQVWGKLTLDSSVMYDTSIGASDRINCSSDYRSFKSDFPAPCSRPVHQVSDFRVKDGCNFSTSGTWTAAKCSQTSSNGGPNGKIWLDCSTPPSPETPTTCTSTDVTSPAFSSAPDDMLLTAPSVPPATFDLGPGKPCAATTGTPPGFTDSTFELMKSSSYSCTSADGAGELSWNHLTNTLTVRGDIYFTRNMKLESGRWGLFGPGKGRIFLGEHIELTNNTGLCGKRDTVSPECDNDEGDWDPGTADNVVTFITGSTLQTSIIQDNFNFQGGLNTKGGYLVQGTSDYKGPLLIEGPVEIKNNGVVDAWAPFNSPTGPPGGPLELRFIPGSWRG